MRTHAYRNSTGRCLSLCEGSLRVPADSVVHIPDTAIEHPDVLHLIGSKVLVPYVEPVPVELPLQLAPAPEAASLLATRRRKSKSSDATNTNNAG